MTSINWSKGSSGSGGDHQKTRWKPWEMSSESSQGDPMVPAQSSPPQCQAEQAEVRTLA